MVALSPYLLGTLNVCVLFNCKAFSSLVWTKVSNIYTAFPKAKLVQLMSKKSNNEVKPEAV